VTVVTPALQFTISLKGGPAGPWCAPKDTTVMRLQRTVHQAYALTGLLLFNDLPPMTTHSMILTACISVPSLKTFLVGLLALGAPLIRLYWEKCIINPYIH